MKAKNGKHSANDFSALVGRALRALWAGCPQDRPRPRHARLCLARWKNCGRETLKAGELEKLCSLEFHFKAVNSRFKKLGL